MKILVTGDIHFIKSHFKWIEDEKDQFDCICLTGDFLNERLGGFDEQTLWVAQWIQSLNKQVFICSGNHDLDDLGECEWLENLQGPGVCTDNCIKNFKGVKFGCIPFIGADLSDFHDCNILLTHVPPFKTSVSIDKETKRDFGDKALYDALRTKVIMPEYIFCGHVENPMERRDSVFGVNIINAGANHEKSIPQYEIIIIDI